jgi:hypothetical protein
MIKLAEESEKADPLGCQYSVGNAANLSIGERFDVVVGVYLLNYASSKAMLLDLCGTIHDHPKLGGIFVGINASMALDRPSMPITKVRVDAVDAREPSGGRCDHPFVITNPDGTRFQIDNFFLRPETYAAAFADTGFCAFVWEDLWVSDAGRQWFPDGYWNAMLTDPPIVGMRAER